MSPRHLLCILALLLAGAGAAAAAPKTPTAGELEEQFREIYDQIALAIQNLDSVKFLSFLGPNFTYISADGTERSREEMIARHEQNMKTTREVRFVNAKIESIMPLGNGDVAVIVTQRYNRDQVAQNEPGKPRNVQTAIVQRDIWHQELTGWKLERTEEILAGPVMLDGKWVAPP